MARRPLIPKRGNPMRPILIYLGCVLGALLITMTAIMLSSGAGIAETIAVALIIAVAASVCYAIIRAMADRYMDDWERLLAGEMLASWRLSPDEHRRFLDEERRRSRQLVVALVLIGLVLGVTLGFAEDWLLGTIMGGSFLFAAGVARFFGSPPRSADGQEGREVRIASHGVQVLGRYVPFRAPMARIRRTELRPGDPAVLIIHVGSGNRLSDIRVPVPRDRLAEAEALAHRLFQEASG